MMNNQLELVVNSRKDGNVLLICSGSGRIVFAVGDMEILEIKHSKVIQRNLFSLGFTLRSLVEVRRKFPNGVLNFPLDSNKKIRMEYIRRNKMEEEITETNWKNMKQSFVKCLQLKCSTLKAYFSDEQIRHRHCQLLKLEAIMPKQDESEEDLVLVQVGEIVRVEIRTEKDDYLYSRTRILQSESNDALLEEDQ